MNQKNLESLKLNDEQLARFKELQTKEKAFRRILASCGINQIASEYIINKSDLDKVDLGHEEELKQAIKLEFADIIIQKGVKK